jgi:hypothetical protein
LGVQTLFDTSLLPAPALGLSLSGDVLFAGVLRAGLTGKAFASQSATLAGAGGGDFSLWLVETRICYQLGRASQRSLRAALCPSFNVGVMNAVGTEVERPRSQQSVLYAPGLSALGAVGLTERLATTLNACALFPIITDSFALNAGQLHELPSASLQIGLGLEMRVD